MRRFFLISNLILTTWNAYSQNNLTPELLWKLGRVSAVGITKDNKGVVYALSIPNVDENKNNRRLYYISLTGGTPRLVADSNSL